MTKATETAKKQTEAAIATARNIVEETAAKADAAGKTAKDNAEKTFKVVEDTNAVLKDGLYDFQQKVFEISKSNLDATFDHAQALVAVKTPAEILELNNAFASKQVSALTAQAQELGAISMKLAEDAAKPVQAGVKKSFEDAKKTFAA